MLQCHIQGKIRKLTFDGTVMCRSFSENRDICVTVKGTLNVYSF